MPNGKTHLIAGLVVGATVNVVIQSSERRRAPCKQFDWGELLFCAGAAGAAALLPDLLEPATSPNHRQFFHSIAAAALVAYAMSGEHTIMCSRATRLLLTVLGLGYLSHLCLDCTTPKAINLI